jgi:hypothetical protein
MPTSGRHHPAVLSLVRFSERAHEVRSRFFSWGISGFAPRPSAIELKEHGMA